MASSSARPHPQIYSISDAAHRKQASQASGLSTAELSLLRDESVAAKAAAYCPYSRFRVGAALLVRDGDGGAVVQGANVENASYPVTTCAERVALTRAVVEGRWRRGASSFRALAVSTDIAPPASPCGMCRQCIREFCDLDMPIIMFGKNDDFIVLKLEDLLPLSFGPEALGV